MDTRDASVIWGGLLTGVGGLLVFSLGLDDGSLP